MNMGKNIFHSSATENNVRRLYVEDMKTQKTNSIGEISNKH